MLRTVRDACELHPMALDYSMSEQVENLSDVIATTSVKGVFREELCDEGHGDAAEPGAAATGG